MGAVAIDFDLAKQRKADTEVGFTELGDFPGIARLLLAELVARKAQHHQAALAVTLPKLLKPLVLRGKTALTGGIDHQQYLALEIAQDLLLTAQGDAGNVQQRVGHDLFSSVSVEPGPGRPS
ncbi:hypothetical protein D3C81_1557910 [compost metagenome]